MTLEDNGTYICQVNTEPPINQVIVYYDVGYFNIGFERVISMWVWLAANCCFLFYVDYGIGIVGVGNNKLCYPNNTHCKF